MEGSRTFIKVLKKVAMAVNKLPEEDQEQLDKDIYYDLNGGHYDDKLNNVN